MLQNNITSALRNLVRNKVYSIINISGLALALSCFTMIFLYVENELSFDRFHHKPENIYRIVKDFVNDDGTKVPDATTPPALVAAVRDELSEVDYATRLFPSRGRLYLLEYKDQRSYERNLISVDSNFFNVFDFPLVAGDKNKCLRDARSIVMTETTAKKYFGEEDPLNKVIRMNLNNGTDFVVTGILKDIPQNSHFTFDILIPFESGRNPDTDWRWSGFYAYVRLKEGVEPQRFASNVKQVLERHQPSHTDEYHVQHLTDIHLGSHLKWELGVNGDTLNVKTMMLIGMFVLLIAAINYVNLVTAQAARRSKEVGIRKVNGANRLQLVRQFMLESALMVLISLAFSTIITSLLLPYSKSLLAVDLSMLAGESQYLNFVLPGVAMTIALFAGLYPAFYLSSFQPLAVLKFGLLRGTRGIHVRRGLVIFQFVISTGLIIGSLTIASQLNFMKEKKLGFDNENILLLPNVRGGIGNSSNPGDMLEEMKEISGVRRIARADGVIGYNNSTNGVATRDQKTHVVLNFIRADYEFLPALNIRLKEGRNFSESFPSDSEAVILNEAAVIQLGLKEPYLGQQLSWDDSEGRAHNVNLIGIVEDFHFGSFRDTIKPFGFILEVGNGSTFFLKLEQGDVNHTLAMIRSVWTKYYPDRPFDYSFQDEEFNKLHVAEARFKKLFSAFTILALFIACLGMFGLATFLAETKTKEIGIRKVLGASVSGIAVLISKDFLKLVIVAVIISSPLAWYLMHQWLQGFAYHISPHWSVFALTSVASVAITLLTVSYQSVKAAMTDPVKSLRSE